MSMNYPSPPQTQATSTDSNGKSPSSSSLDNGHQSRNSNNLNGNGYYDQDNSSGSNLTYDRSIIFERVNESPINAHHQQPPTPPPGIIASPIRKRKDLFHQCLEIVVIVISTILMGIPMDQAQG